MLYEKAPGKHMTIHYETINTIRFVVKDVVLAQKDPTESCAINQNLNSKDQLVSKTLVD